MTPAQEKREKLAEDIRILRKRVDKLNQDIAKNKREIKSLSERPPPLKEEAS